MTARSGSARQAVARVQATAAKAAGLPLEKVIVHNHLIGGGFGRRLEADGAARAVQIAKQVDGPVKVVWTREEDIQHDMYRPYWFDRHRRGSRREGQAGRLDQSLCRILGHREMAAAGLQQWSRSRHDRGRHRSRLRPAQLPCRVCPGGASGYSHRVLAQRRPVSQCVRHRKLHG